MALQLADSLDFTEFHMKNIVVLITGILSLMYLFNFGSGFLELIPDNIPFVGNMDEATAMVLLLNCLRYFGINLFDIFERKS
ncbi:MAG: DUF1232 domain-containing protein [Proteobacteria bacterium]|nr:DUF1232 domain-containing protein [Desulfobulbaceae bacterium]MBU4154079.1 DUF1232 domain-containing protein [Pseudomonadota bacterium]